MIALATPFGTYIKDATESTLTGLFDTSESALNVVGMSATSNGTGTPNHNGTTIPTGATYQITGFDGICTNCYADLTGDTYCPCGQYKKSDNVTMCDICSYDFSSGRCYCETYCVDDICPSQTLVAGDKFPETTQPLDVYTYGDYTYVYSASYMAEPYTEPLNNQFCNGGYDGWLVTIRQETPNSKGLYQLEKTKFGKILDSINGSPITNMEYTFYNATIDEKPTIPSSVTDTSRILEECTIIGALTTMTKMEYYDNQFTSFANSSVWTDGTNIYYSDDDNHYVFVGDTWESVTLNNVTYNFKAKYVWSDGVNTYYSYNDEQFVFDKATSTWIGKSWSGGPQGSYIMPARPGESSAVTYYTALYGDCIWSDGANIYYSQGSSKQYVLNGDTWEPKTWNGITNFNGSYIWTDSTNTFYSNGTVNYVLKGDTWEEKTWNINIKYNHCIWTDGTNTYYSNDSEQYMLYGNTWVSKIWNGLDTNFLGSSVRKHNSSYYLFQGMRYYYIFS